MSELLRSVLFGFQIRGRVCFIAWVEWRSTVILLFFYEIWRDTGVWGGEDCYCVVGLTVIPGSEMFLSDILYD